MHPQHPPSAHVCTPRPERRTKPRNHSPAAAGDCTGQQRNHHAEWAALTFTQQEEQARDHLVAMLDRAAWNSPEALALSHAAAVLTIKINDRAKAQGGAA